MTQLVDASRSVEREKKMNGCVADFFFLRAPALENAVSNRRRYRHT